MKRKKTMVVQVGTIAVGHNHPVAIQSMTNTATHDIEKTVEQIISIWKAGADFVRVTIPNTKDLEATKEIKAALNGRGLDIPLVADIHFSPKLAIQSAAIVDKVRINPGNFAELGGDFKLNEQKQRTFIRQKVSGLVTVCNQYNTAIRIGVNHGSLSERMLQKYGDTPEGMVFSVMEYLEIFQASNFNRIIISLKSSNPLIMIYANRLLKRKMNEAGINFPLHLGVTEAGDGEAGRMKSAVGIGTLLLEGIGETIRVSLTEPPENEIPVAKKIIQYANERKAIPLSDSKTLKLPETFVKRHVFPVPHFDYSKYSQVLVAEKDFDYEAPQHILFCDNDPLCKKVINPSVIPSSPDVYSVPVLTVKGLNAINTFPDSEKMLLVTLNELKDNLEHIKQVANLTFIYNLNDSSPVNEIDLFFSFLEKEKMNNPVIFHKHYNEDDLEILQVKVAMDFGRHFINGYGNGLFITNSGKITNDEISQLSYSLLQATRTLITKTEYIACPSCGRTLFDLETTTQKIRSRTSHLKGLKIAIMGCIVNGIGEMADADYGYVGGASGKITLYKNRAVVKKNIPEEKAVDELIALIKKDGDWIAQ